MTTSKTIPVGRVEIGPGRPAAVIAESACEHLGSLEVAKRMVDAAKAAGVDIIKFQLHLPDDEVVAGMVRFGDQTLDEILARVNLPIEAHRELIAYCRHVGLQYLCTPFCSRAADVLEDLGVEAFKIGSGELTNLPMLRHIARKGKPMLVSTGMATWEEIEQAVGVVRAEGTPLALLHCTSAYPPRYEQVNLRVIPKLQQAFGVPVGYSDHTPDIWTALGAIVVGAAVIEKHFTLDHALQGPDHTVSLVPDEFRVLVEAIRKIEAALGDEKKVHDEEALIRRWAHHSIVTAQAIRAGSVLDAGLLTVKRPGWGVPAKHLEAFFGTVAKRDLPANTLLTLDDVDWPAGRPTPRGSSASA